MEIEVVQPVYFSIGTQYQGTTVTTQIATDTCFIIILSGNLISQNIMVFTCLT